MEVFIFVAKSLVEGDVFGFFIAGGFNFVGGT